MEKTVSGIILTLLLASMLTLTFNIQPVEAEPATLIVPDDYPTIQEAINAASPRDTVYVKAGTYYEQVVVNKNNLKLVGQDPKNTIIDGGGVGTVVKVTVSNVNISSFTVQHGTYGINIGGRELTAHNNVMKENTISGCHFGVYIDWSSNNTLIRNNMTGNSFNFKVVGYYLSHYIQHVDPSNTVNGKPVYYLINQCNLDINPTGFPEIGYLGIVNSTCVTVMNLNLSDNGQGLLFAYTLNSTAKNLNLNGNHWGVHMVFSNNNTVEYNMISWCGDGVLAWWSARNIISHNTLSHDGEGIHLWMSPCNTLINNTISRCGGGIQIARSETNTLKNNLMINNEHNFWQFGMYEPLSYHIQDIDTSNKVNGKPMYYLINKHNIIVSPSTLPNMGYLAIVNSTGVLIKDINLTHNGNGIFLAHTENSTIQNASLSNNWEAITLCSCRNIEIIRCTIQSNWIGIALRHSDVNTIKENMICDSTWYTTDFRWSHNNHIYHNTFISGEVFLADSANTWDNGYPSGGNYWSDYNGTDFYTGPYQNETGSDGIGDTPYVIDENNTDRYPLMNPWGKAGTPIANFGWSPATPEVNELVTFNASASMPIGGEIVSYEWDFGDGNYASGKIVTHRYGTAGTFTVTLNVTDSEGLWDIEQKQIEVKAPPPPLTVTISPTSASILVGQSVTFTSTVSGGYTPYTYQWYLNGNPVSGATADTWTFTPTESGIFYVYLKVTDDKGNTAQSETARITVSAVPVGGYSIPINVPTTTTKPVTPYIALLTILTATLTTIKRKTKRKH